MGREKNPLGLLFVYSGSVFEPYTWTFLIHDVDQAEAKTELFREPFSLETLVHFAAQNLTEGER